MKKRFALLVFGCAVMAFPDRAPAQGFGEYGRAVGSVPRGSVTAPRSPGGGAQGRVDGGGVGDLGGRSLPARLVVSSKQAGLFPRQDDEIAQLAQLNEGEKLVPLVQSEGSTQWYMVKTEKGLTGWVKSTDVREEPPPKKQ